MHANFQVKKVIIVLLTIYIYVRTFFMLSNERITAADCSLKLISPN